MSDVSDIRGLARKLGHDFSDPARLERAVTHPSAATGMRPDNQRLEFLGDRVLGLIMAEHLMRRFPDLPEGELAPRFNALVRREALARIAGEIELGRHLRLGRSEQLSGGRRKAAILADAMEAVIAALYLDGGLEAARAFVEAHWKDAVETVRANPVDAKTRLQEALQGMGRPAPEYVEIAREGPAHAPEFTVEVRVEDGPTERGIARSKKLAEQQAARAALEKLEAPHD